MFISVLAYIAIKNLLQKLKYKVPTIFVFIFWPPFPTKGLNCVKKQCSNISCLGPFNVSQDNFFLACYGTSMNYLLNRKLQLTTHRIFFHLPLVEYFQCQSSRFRAFEEGYWEELWYKSKLFHRSKQKPCVNLILKGKFLRSPFSSVSHPTNSLTRHIGCLAKGRSSHVIQNGTLYKEYTKYLYL